MIKKSSKVEASAQKKKRSKHTKVELCLGQFYGSLRARETEECVEGSLKSARMLIIMRSLDSIFIIRNCKSNNRLFDLIHAPVPVVEMI